MTDILEPTAEPAAPVGDRRDLAVAAVAGYRLRMTSAREVALLVGAADAEGALILLRADGATTVGSLVHAVRVADGRAGADSAQAAPVRVVFADPASADPASADADAPHPGPEQPPVFVFDDFDRLDRLDGFDGFDRLGSGADDELQARVLTADGGAGAGIVSEQERFDFFLARLLAADPATRLDDISLLTPRERSLVDAWNATGHPVPALTLPELVEASAAAHPDRPAVRSSSARLSYAELNERANRLARLLIRNGAGRGDLVAMVLPRSVDYLVGALAVVKTGAAYLPVDTGYPADRINQILADAGPAQVLTSAALAPSVDTPAALVLLDDPGTALRLAAEDPADPTDADRRTPLTPDNPAYVLYTSGSTGRPKGVVVAHRAITNRLHHMQSEIPLGAGDRLLQKTPAGFDVTVREVFWPLIAGAEIVVAAPEGHRDPAYLAETISAERITVAHFVPSGLKAFLQEPEAADCTSLRHVVCGGEALPAELQGWVGSVLDAELLNVYGPTEAAVDVSSMVCPRKPEPGPVLIGRPVWNTRLYVLDERQREVPPGVLGELYLAGVQLAEGYLGRPDLTAERFLPDPFHPGDRMYRTGDLARWRADGMMEFFGRIDHQVKIRGFRVELDEIESAVLREPGVSQTAVIVREDAPGDQRLVAYLVTAADNPPDTEALRARLARELPDYMVPSAFVRLERLPLTPNEKLDRNALPRPESARVRAGRAPQGREQLLVELFALLLGIPEAGIEVADSFFELGGNSLLAARLISGIRAATGVRLRITQVFEGPTVQALAEHLS